MTAFPPLENQVQDLERRIRELEARYVPHGLRHSSGGGDEIALAIYENGTLQTKLLGLNFDSNFGITPNASAKRHDLDMAPHLAAADPHTGYVLVTGDTMTGALTISLATGNSLIIDGTTFVVSAGNNRVGILTASPSYDLSFGAGAARVIGIERSALLAPGVALTLRAGDTTLGATNVVGGALVARAGIGTGNSQPAQIQLQGPLRGNSGTADQVLANRLIANGVIELTSGTVATLLTIPLATLEAAGGLLVYTVVATDGTDLISASGQVVWSAVNKGGTYTTTSDVVDTEAQAKSDGTDTIANTFSFTNGTNQTTFRVTSTLTGLTAVAHRIIYSVFSHGMTSVTAP